MSKSLVTSMIQLSIYELRKEGDLVAGRYISRRWTKKGNVFASLHFAVKKDRLTITDDKWQALYDIPLTWTACPLGGFRPWFRCPRCGRRCAVVYTDGVRMFRCGKCLNLGYPSQLEDTSYRAMRRAHKIQKRLGPWLSKPPGMHEKTYKRLLTEYEYFDRKSLIAMAGRLKIVVPPFLSEVMDDRRRKR